MKKRYGAPRAKAGQLKLQWGKLPDSSPDICMVWGDGVSRNDGALLHCLISSPTYSVIRKTYDPSFLEELEERGYDITTLKISVEKKATGNDIDK